MVNPHNPMHALAALFIVHRDLLSQIAEAWLDAGAVFFGIWFKEELIVGWPEGTLPSGGMITAPLQVNGFQAQLRAYGKLSIADQFRLVADASIIEKLAALESELNSMTQ